MNWPVMKLCNAQLEDINQEDVLDGGLYRKCNTYKGGGGYDKFPIIYSRRYNKKIAGLNNQFVVQLKGCPLDCPYCYVTKAGVESGECKTVETKELVSAFQRSQCNVFHLMGGAPAIYLDYWPDLLRQLNGAVFHSDFLLIERIYNLSTLEKIAKYQNALYAISIKGSTDEEFLRNTNRKFNKKLFYKNLDSIISSHIPFYFTFTGMAKNSIDKFCDDITKKYGDESLLNDSFAISIIKYKALDYIEQKEKIESDDGK